MKYTIAGFLLCLLGTIRVFADILGFEKLSAVAAVTNAAPAMKVFTAYQGYETYSSVFELTIDLVDGRTMTTRLNPANYSGLKGPYNRRNVYGALIAYGPVLFQNPQTRAMWEVMAERAFCRQPSVLAELTGEFAIEPKRATIEYTGQVHTEGPYPHRLSIACVR